MAGASINEVESIRISINEGGQDYNMKNTKFTAAIRRQKADYRSFHVFVLTRNFQPDQLHYMSRESTALIRLRYSFVSSAQYLLVSLQAARGYDAPLDIIVIIMRLL